MREGFGQDPTVNIFASRAISKRHQLPVFVFFSYLEENFSSSRKIPAVGCRICAKGLEDALGFVQRSRAVISAWLGKGRRGNGTWSIFV